MFDVKGILEQLTEAESVVRDAKENDSEGLKRFYRSTSTARALADQAKAKSEDQLAIRGIVVLACDSLEREVMG